MALTKFDVASSALVMLGANPVSSFDSSGTTEEIACHHLYQSAIDNLLSLYPWRFATRSLQMSRDHENDDNPLKPVGWQAVYTVPSDMRAMQTIRLNKDGRDIPYDRFENKVFCNAVATDAVYAIYTYEPPVAWWPGYFTELAEVGVAGKLAFALSGKLDLRVDLEKLFEVKFRLAKNADSRQQTTRKFKLRGRNSIMEARQA
jgi:hypothetical protein